MNCDIMGVAGEVGPRPRTGTPSLSRSQARFSAKTNGITIDFMRSNPMINMFSNPNVRSNTFRGCAEPGCLVSSEVAEFNAMTMRTGLSYCLKHVKANELTQKTQNKEVIVNKTLIFYDIEMSRDGEIEQLGACVQPSIDFSAIIRTSVRSNSSPFLKQIPAKTWNVLAEEPRSAMMRFNAWIMATHDRLSGGDTNPSNIMLAAHYGSCHDHVHVLKAMMKWGINPPNYLLVDTLAIFKTIKGTNEPATLSTLVTKYAPWVDHTAHDADSDADALRVVSTIAFRDTKTACYAFSIACSEFMARSGLSMYSPTPMTTTTYKTTPSFLSRSRSGSSDKNTVTSRSSF